ncbi:MAG: hypothetical protein HY321_22580 [Armatimonadetes bacterium]|nr:hypothetical protein [Armatimonadota bacterium]
MMLRRLLVATLVCLSAGLAASPESGPRLPVRADGFLLVAVDEALMNEILAAQDGKGPAFTIAIDGAKAEPLAVSPERLRDYQNVYFRVAGAPGAWRLEERTFVVGGADSESQLIRRALAVPEGEMYFLPGREHLLVPAQSRVVIRAGGSTWNAQVAAVGSASGPRRAVVLRSGQTIPLALGEAISSLAARRGDTVPLSVADDVRVDGLVAVPRGAAASARIVSVLRPGLFGTPGRVVLELSPVRAADDGEVVLRGARGSRLTFQGRPTCPFRRGRDVAMPAGTLLRAQAASTVAVLTSE